MKIIKVLVCCLMAVAVSFTAADSRAEEGKPLSLDSLPGIYEGRMQIHNARQTEFSYKTEVLSVDRQANTVSLVNSCRDCEVKEVKRNDCRITGVKENITFVCKGKFSDEEYSFNGERLKATGAGAKFPFTISVTKVAK
jgi:hypothetical protein